MSPKESFGSAASRRKRVELDKLALDRAKFDFDKIRDARDSRFLARNASALIAASIALAGALVAAAGVLNTRELESQKIIQQENLIQEQIRQSNARARTEMESLQRHDAERQAENELRTKVALRQFIQTFSKELLSEDPRVLSRMKRISRTAFPEQAPELLAMLNNGAQTIASTKSSSAKPPVAGGPPDSPHLEKPSNFPVTLDTVSVTFDTTTEDKDFDTGVSVAVECSGRTVARTYGTWGRWAKGTSFGPIPLTVITQLQRDKYPESCSATIVEAPVGHDEWHFKWQLLFRFSNGEVLKAGPYFGDVDYDRNTVLKQLKEAA